MRTLLTFLSLVCSLGAQVALRPPAFGCQVTGAHTLRTLEGLPASLIAVPLVGDAQAAACSSRLTVYQTSGRVVLLSGEEHFEFETSEAQMLAAGDEIAVAVSRVTGFVRTWNQGDWADSPLTLPADVRAIRITGANLMFLAEDRLITISIGSGVEQSNVRFDATSSPIAILSSDSIITVVDNMWNRCVPSVCLPLAAAPSGVTSLEILNSEWIAVRLDSGDDLAIRPSAGGVESFQLPGEVRP